MGKKKKKKKFKKIIEKVETLDSADAPLESNPAPAAENNTPDSDEHIFDPDKIEKILFVAVVLFSLFVLFVPAKWLNEISIWFNNILP